MSLNIFYVYKYIDEIGLPYYKSKQRWYNNGKKSIMIIPGTEPSGFMPGRIAWRTQNDLA